MLQVVSVVLFILNDFLWLIYKSKEKQGWLMFTFHPPYSNKGFPLPNKISSHTFYF